jgi:hypothetical protein
MADAKVGNARHQQLFNDRATWFPEQIDGNGFFRASPAAFISAMLTFNTIVWEDLRLDLGLSRLRRSGLVLFVKRLDQWRLENGRLGIMLVIPSQVARFFGVSEGFVTKHLDQWGWDTDHVAMDDIADIKHVFPPVIWESDFLRTPRLQFRFWRPPESPPDPPEETGVRTPDDEEPDPSTLTDHEAESLVLDNVAGALVEADFAELEDLDLALSDSIKLLESVIVDPQGSIDQEVPPDADDTEQVAVDPRIPVLQASLADLSGQRKAIKKNREQLKLRLGRACRTINLQKRQIADLKLRIPAEGTLPPGPATSEPAAPLPPLFRSGFCRNSSPLPRGFPPPGASPMI